jgi:hypothetical protein
MRLAERLSSLVFACVLVLLPRAASAVVPMFDGTPVVANPRSTAS